MKKLFFTMLFATPFFSVFAQHDQTNPNQPAMQTQTMNDWDLYNGTMIETSKVPSTTVQAFNSAYPSRNDERWYSYDRGYIVTYPGSDKMYEGVLYDKSGKMKGTVRRVRYATLTSDVSTNMKKKYPDMNNEYVYEVTSPSGKKMYVSHVNNEWSEFNDNGTMPDK